MVFPRINIAINATLLYYDVKHISSEVNSISGRIIRSKVLDENGKMFPTWDELILQSHANMKAEIQQIIDLNYPHVHASVLEELRDLISTPPFASVQKEHITKLLLDYNRSEDERLIQNGGKGFSLGADPAYLPQYFAKVEIALTSFKTIVKRFLRLYDADKLPVGYQYPSYLPQSIPPIIKEPSAKKLEVNMTGQQLAILFQLLDDAGALKYDEKKEMQMFLYENVKVKSKMESFKYFQNKFNDTVIGTRLKKYMSDLLAEMQKSFRKFK